MNSLADLFTDDRPSIDESTEVSSNLVNDGRLAALVGPPRVQRTGVRRNETAELVALVEDAAKSATPIGAAAKPGAPKASRRGHKRTDWLNVSFAILAVATVAVVGVLGGVQLANASPAASALRSLAVDEASLSNGRQAVESAVARIDALILEARADADTIEPVLASVAGYVDESARAAAQQSVTELRAGLDAVVMPEIPASYSRPTIDTDDLAEVGAQIDAVREFADELTALTDEARATRARVTELRDNFAGAIAALGSSFPMAAEDEIAEYREARQSFIDAVTLAAAAVPSAQAAGGFGAEEMAAYPALVDALREDHERAIAAIVAEREAAAERESDRTPSNIGSGGSGDAGDSGGTGVVTPDPTPTVEPEPAPEPQPQPEPDPEPEPQPQPEPQPTP